MAASVTIDERILPTAPIGAPNPLPAVATMPQAPYEASAEGLPDDIARNLRYGQVRSIHPYLLQDRYDRERTDAPLRLAVLENAHLRAEFALGLGGRLTALVDTATGRDLVYRNAIFQPANLALRNAWFSGGAEWNVGMRGHSPLTCDPLYAAVVTGPDGEPVLRMWEYERVRGLIVQLDATLSEDGPALVTRVRVRNPHPRETGMYWWTNIAVAQEEGSRVFAPAMNAYRTGYDGSLTRIALDDFDSRPARATTAADVFFDTDASVQPWIAALGADSAGLAHVSTAPLTGRKLFVWGAGTGGKRWCEWLGGEYFEIQAGLTTTQYEHLPMPGGATWEWTETFLPLHVSDARREAPWAEAIGAVGAAVEAAARATGTDAVQRLDAVADVAPGEELLSEGSPWGALEQELAEWTGSSFAGLPGVRFSRDAGIEGTYWRELLDGTATEDADGGHPASYVAGDGWDRLLAEAPPTWLTAYHRAVIAHASGALDRARKLYAESLHLRETAWAARGAGQAALAAGDEEAGIDALRRAHELAPDCVPITEELGEALLATGHADDARSLLGALPDEVRAQGRFRLLAVRTALADGDRETAGRMLEDTFEVPDLREGELSMSGLWQEAFGDRPVPAHYDFSMN